MLIQLALPAALLATLLVAVRFDLAERRIPNAVSGIALAAGLVLHGMASGSAGLAHAALGAALGLAVLLPFYLLKGTGAGDVKLMAAIGALLGPTDVVLAAVATLVLGAVLAVGVALVQWRTVVAPPDVLKQRFPYAVAIAGGTLLVMWQQGHLTAMADTLRA